MSQRGRQWLVFVAALAALGIANAIAFMPIDPGFAHPSEWFALYFTPPVVWGLLSAGAGWLIKPAPEGGRKRDVQAPLLGAFVVSVVVSGMAACSEARAAPRSAALRAEFIRQNPCPANGATRGVCPGWQVDHREALICGGKDELGNLQWLTIEEHKAKTRVEVKLCRPRASAGLLFTELS